MNGDFLHGWIVGLILGAGIMLCAIGVLGDDDPVKVQKTPACAVSP